VVTPTPSLTEMVYSLDAGGDLVGVTDYTDYAPEAHAKRSVGGMVDPSIERIVALHPDIVFAESKANRPSTIAVQRLGIPVFVVRAEGLDGIVQALQQVGTALNRTSVARALADRLQARREEVARRVSGLPKPRVFVLIWPDPVVTVGPHRRRVDALADLTRRRRVRDSSTMMVRWRSITSEERRTPFNSPAMLRKISASAGDSRLSSRASCRESSRPATVMDSSNEIRARPSLSGTSTMPVRSSSTLLGFTTITARRPKVVNSAGE
jgi:hypothetical protein